MLTANNVTKAETLYPADPEKTKVSRERTAKALRQLSLSSSTLTTVIMSVVRQVHAQCFPTMQVQLAHDNVPVLGIGPDFVCSIDREEDVVVVLMHESVHLVAQHLNLIDMKKMSDPMYVQTTEAWVNYFCLSILKRDLPTIDGEPTGVDPVKFFEWFKKTASEAGLKDYPRKIEDFFISDENAYNWVSQLPKPRREPKGNFCNHKPGDGMPQPGDGQSGSGEGDGEDFSPVIDPQAAGQLVQKALEVALREAVHEKNQGAKEELKKLMAAADGNEAAEKIFGDLGAYELLGTTSPEKRTRFWDKKVARAIASLIKPGDRLAFNRKRPKERIFSPRGKVEEKSIVIAIDTSGSMFYGDAIQKVRELVGQTKAKARWVWFDGQVWEFQPGDEMHGGGGTNCELVEEWILANCKRYPDAVVVVTDGIFRHFTPSKPKRWIWVVTRDGDTWMKDHEPRMKVTTLPF